MTEYKIVNGIKFAKDVDTSDIDWESPVDPELLEEFKKPAKIRISMMVDEKLLAAIKAHAVASGESRYQTHLHDLLVSLFLDPDTRISPKPRGVFQSIRRLEELADKLGEQHAMTKEILKAVGIKPKAARAQKKKKTVRRRA